MNVNKFTEMNDKLLQETNYVIASTTVKQEMNILFKQQIF